MPRLVQAQQAMVDEDAGELVADGAVDQRRGDAGIDTAGQAEDDLLVADLLADRPPPPRRRGRASPSRAGRRQMSQHEALEQRPALHRVRDLGMELHAVVAARFVGHAGDRAARRAGHQLEARRQRGDLVAVAHPDLEHAVALGGVRSPRCRPAAGCGRARAPRRSRTRGGCWPRPGRPAAPPS